MKNNVINLEEIRFKRDKKLFIEGVKQTQRIGYLAAEACYALSDYVYSLAKDYEILDKVKRRK